MTVVGHLARRDEVAFLHDVTWQCTEMDKKCCDEEQGQKYVSFIVHISYDICLFLRCDTHHSFDFLFCRPGEFVP